MINYDIIIKFIESNIDYLRYIILVLCTLFLILGIGRKKKKKMFYNTGFKIIFSAWDRLKFKIRLADYDDKTGVRYNYLIAFKIFCWDFYRIKYTDQEGNTYKRKLRFGGIK